MRPVSRIPGVAVTWDRGPTRNETSDASWPAAAREQSHLGRLEHGGTVRGLPSPPAVDQNGYGLRVLSILISPCARRGHIDHQTLSSDAYLRFIEDEISALAS